MEDEICRFVMSHDSGVIVFHHNYSSANACIRCQVLSDSTKTAEEETKGGGLGGGRFALREEQCPFSVAEIESSV